MDRLRVNILYEKLYYYENKAQPYPNGMHEYCRETFTELMNHYRKNRMLTHLNNSVVQLYLIEDIWKFEEFKNKDTIYFPEILWSYPFFTKDVSMDLDIVNFDAEKDLDENLIYVYPIVLKGLDSLDVVNLLKRNGKDVRIEKYFNVLDTISEKVISLINKGRCKVILDLEHEGLWSPEKYNRWFEEECMTEEILDKFDFTNFYFLCGDFGCEDKISNKVKINNIPSKFYVDQLSRDVVDLKNEGGHKNELGVFTEVHTMDDIDLSKKTKHFFTMLRNVSKSHRVCLAAYFEYHDLWDKNVISWLKGEWKGKVPNYLDEKYHPMIDKLSDKPIFELDTQNIENKYSFSPMFTWNWEYFQETFLSIVTETTTDYITLTEKTVAPLWNLHPFIHISAPFTLEKLHGLNFKTFHPFIDESYDNETDDAKRMNMIFNELDKFRKKSVEELREWWKEISPILEYNQNNFFNISKEKSTKVNLLESFYETK